MTPVFHQARLREVVDAYYSKGPGSTDKTYHQCFNNIIVLN